MWQCGMQQWVCHVYMVVPCMTNLLYFLYYVSNDSSESVRLVSSRVDLQGFNCGVAPQSSGVCMFVCSSDPSCISSNSYLGIHMGYIESMASPGMYHDLMYGSHIGIITS